MPRFVSTPKKGHGRSRLYERTRKRVLAEEVFCWLCAGEAEHVEFAPFVWDELPFGTIAVDKTLSGLDPAGPTCDHIIPISFLAADDPRMWERSHCRLAHSRCNAARGNRGNLNRDDGKILTRTSRAWLS